MQLVLSYLTIVAPCYSECGTSFHDLRYNFCAYLYCYWLIYILAWKGGGCKFSCKTLHLCTREVFFKNSWCLRKRNDFVIKLSINLKLHIYVHIYMYMLYVGSYWSYIICSVYVYFFLHRHVSDTMIILEDSNLAHPRCSRCDMLVPWKALNGWHFTTNQCAKGAEQKRWQLA